MPAQVMAMTSTTHGHPEIALYKRDTLEEQFWDPHGTKPILLTSGYGLGGTLIQAKTSLNNQIITIPKLCRQLYCTLNSQISFTLHFTFIFFQLFHFPS